MTVRSPAFALALLAGAFAQGATTSGVREQFAYSIPLGTEPGAAIYRFALPTDVYRHVTRADLGDLRVLNAAGEVVPYALRAPPAEASLARSQVSVAFFPLRGDPVSATRALRLTIRDNEAAVEVQGSGASPDNVPVTAYLLDARSIRGEIKALQLAWPADAADFSTPVSVEASDTLVDWAAVDAAAPLVNLSHGGQRLLQNRIEFAPRAARFWRLRWPDGRDAVPLTGVAAQPADSRVETQRLQLTVPMEPMPDALAGYAQYLADLGASVPVERFQLILPQVNTVTQAELRALAHPRDAGRVVWQGVAYRLGAPPSPLPAAGSAASNSGTASVSGETAAAPQSIASTRKRYFALRVPRDGGGVGAGSPQFVVEWIPHEVIFAARGEAPYELVYGSGSSLPASVPLSGFLSAQAANGDRVAAVAKPGAETLAGGLDRLQVPKAPTNWRTIALWSVLALAVAVLTWMAWRLSRQMGNPDR